MSYVLLWKHTVSFPWFMSSFFRTITSQKPHYHWKYYFFFKTDLIEGRITVLELLLQWMLGKITRNQSGFTVVLQPLSFFFFCHLCVTGMLSACATGQVNLIYLRCIHWEVRTCSLKMTNITSDRVPTSLNCLPFRSTFTRERRKTEDGTLHTV